MTNHITSNIYIRKKTLKEKDYGDIDKLYKHLQNKYPDMQFDSRDSVGECLKYQEVNQLFQFQKKPRIVSSMIPISIDIFLS